MKLATTTGDFALFTPSHAERLRHVYDAEFRYVDLSMYDDFAVLCARLARLYPTLRRICRKSWRYVCTGAFAGRQSFAL